MQAENLNQCTAIKYISYQRAGRKDAEPITVSENTVVGFFFVFVNITSGQVGPK
jgi:hypothetical protein